MSSESAASAPAGMASYTCIACRVAFKDADVQRAHYKTDWHRYNLKRKVADMPPVTAENFQERVLAQRAGLEEQNKATATYCTACSKRFSNFNAYENHLKSKKHLELEKKAVQAVSKKVELMNEKNLEKGLTQENVDKDAMNAAIQQAIKAQPSSSPKKTSGLASNTAGSPVAAESSSSQQNRERAEKPPRVHWFEQQVKKLARESEDEGQEEEEDMEEGWEDVNSDEDVESEEEQMEGNDKEVEESAAGQSHLSADAIPVTNCLFCSHHSSSLMKNVAHMTKDHSFFIPDIEYLVDLRGLIKYLGEKVGIGKVCLWCNEKGKSFYTTESVQAHMNDKSHCKLFTEGDAALEFADFYDFRSSYPDYQEGEDAEMSKELPSEKNIEYDDESMELILPSATCPTRSFPTPCSPCSFSSPQDRARSRYRGSFRGFLPDSWTQHHRSRYCELKQDPWCRFRPRSPRYAPYHWEHKGHCGRDWEQYSTMSSQHHPAHQACQCSSWDLNLPPRPLAPSATVSCPPAASTAPPSESALQPSASVVIQPPIPRPLAQPVGTTLPPSTKLLPSEGTLPWFQHDTLASSSHSKMEDPASDSDDSNKALEFSPNHPAIFARALYPTEEQLIRMGNSLGLQVKQQSPLSKDPILRLIADLETSVTLPMLPTLLDVVKESWGKPAAVPPTSKRLDHLYRVQQKECDFLFTHPSPNSMVVEFSPHRGRRASLSVPSDKEGRKLDGMGKKVYALASTSLKIANHMACMGSFQHFLWEKISPALDHLPEDVKQMAMSVKDEALMLSKQQIAASRHIVDCGSKSLAAAVALRRHAWLRSSSFPPDAKAKIEDLPFEGEGLFSNKTDETLEKMAKLKRLARSLSLNRRT